MNFHLTNVDGSPIGLKSMNIPKGDAFIVFSDLDGTLLDHGSYSFEPAMDALEQLKRHDIPLILASSKTKSEIEVIQEALGFGNCAAIVENGAGLFVPGEDNETSGEIYQDLLKKISDIELPYRSKFKGFSQWNIGEIAEITGLEHQDAKRAKQRQFSEPGVWLGTDDELEEFRDCLKADGISIQKGGRFLTLSFGSQKSRLMQNVMNMHLSGNAPRFSIALGDAPNDIAMLEEADLGIVIPNPSHNGIGPLAGENTGNIVRARYPGPKGWNMSILEVLRNAGLGA